MRDKKRYLLVETSAKVNEDEKSFSYSLGRELIRCIGEINYHKVNPRFMKMVDDRHFIIRSSLEGTSQMVLAFSLIKRVNNTELSFYTLKSSGTIKALQKPPKQSG